MSRFHFKNVSPIITWLLSLLIRLMVKVVVDFRLVIAICAPFVTINTFWRVELTTNFFSFFFYSLVRQHLDARSTQVRRLKSFLSSDLYVAVPIYIEYYYLMSLLSTPRSSFFLLSPNVVSNLVRNEEATHEGLRAMKTHSLFFS